MKKTNKQLDKEYKFDIVSLRWWEVIGLFLLISGITYLLCTLIIMAVDYLGVFK